MHIVEIYKHNCPPYEVLVNQEDLIDLVMMLQDYDKCLQFKVHSAVSACISADYFRWSAKNFPKWVTEFDYDL